MKSYPYVNEPEAKHLIDARASRIMKIHDPEDTKKYSGFYELFAGTYCG